MAVNNSLVKKKEPKFSVAIQSEGYKKLINNTLSDPRRAANFVTAITSAVSSNPALQNCDAGTILSAGLLGETLQLSPSPQLGQYYIVPFKDKNRGPIAQFQLGYKGYIQLAIRSGQYKKLNTLAIKEGELISFDPLTEDISVKLIDDDEEREAAPTIGYYAFFEYLNGFRKVMYWSKKKMYAHAIRYSQSFLSDINKNTSYSFWTKDFDSMANKTMLRQLISKWGVMSIDFQKAYEADMGVIGTDGGISYVEETDGYVEDTNGYPEPEQMPNPETVIIPEEPAFEQDPASALFGSHI